MPNGSAMGFIGDRRNSDQLEASLARAGTFEKEAKLNQSPLELHSSLKWPREAGPFLAAVKLEHRLLVVLYQAAKGSVWC